jgi:hypothetical protein
MIRIVVFIDWLIYYYIDTTQRDGSYQTTSTHYSYVRYGTHLHPTKQGVYELLQLRSNINTFNFICF